MPEAVVVLGVPLAELPVVAVADEPEVGDDAAPADDGEVEPEEGVVEPGVAVPEPLPGLSA